MVIQEITFPFRPRVEMMLILVVLAALLAACGSSASDRVSVPTSDPPVACSRVEGARASKDAEAAINHAKAAWAAIHQKDPADTRSAPDYIAQFEPYSAVLKDGVWHVQGTTPPQFHGYLPVMSVCRNDEGAAAGSIKVP